MKLRPFELGLVIVFGVMMLTSFILLKTYEPKEDLGNVVINSPVTIWGTVPDKIFSLILRELSENQPTFRMVAYRYVAPENFDTEFINALADQNPPDLLFFTHDKLVEHRSRLQAIPFESFPIRDFRDIYLDGAEIFSLSDGVYGFPIAVDPLVMYWNRDVFSDNGLLTPPATWEDIVNNIAPKLTIRDFNRNIERSTIAMGEYTNINNVFPVLSTLLLQAGSRMVVEESDNKYRLRLNEAINPSRDNLPLTSSLTFFTNFSNVNNSLYNWNRSLPLDRDMFLRESLALYFGFGSESRDLEVKNPNLSFDIAEVPQGANTTNKRTYGKFYGFFLTKASKNKASAVTVMNTLSSEANTKRIADTYNFAPVYKSLISQGSNDVYGRIIYRSAINARGWLNPDLDRISEVFKLILEDISSNRRDVSSGAGDATQRLQAIY